MFIVYVTNNERHIFSNILLLQIRQRLYFLESNLIAHEAAKENI